MASGPLLVYLSGIKEWSRNCARITYTVYRITCSNLGVEQTFTCGTVCVWLLRDRGKNRELQAKKRTAASVSIDLPRI